MSFSLRSNFLVIERRKMKTGGGGGGMVEP